MIGCSPCADIASKPAALLSRCPRSTVSAVTPAMSEHSAIATVMTTPCPVPAVESRWAVQSRPARQEWSVPGRERISSRGNASCFLAGRYGSIVASAGWAEEEELGRCRTQENQESCRQAVPRWRGNFVEISNLLLPLASSGLPNDGAPPTGN